MVMGFDWFNLVSDMVVIISIEIGPYFLLGRRKIRLRERKREVKVES